MLFLFLMSILSCGNINLIKNARMSFHKDALCLDVLKVKMQEANCNALQSEQTEWAMIVRCYKDAGQRGKFWDNYIFRISSSKIEFAEEDQKVIDEHTICMDNIVRVEAYKPD